MNLDDARHEQVVPLQAWQADHSEAIFAWPAFTGAP